MTPDGPPTGRFAGATGGLPAHDLPLDALEMAIYQNGREAERLRVGRAHAGKTVTILAVDTVFRVLHHDIEISTHIRKTTAPSTACDRAPTEVRDDRMRAAGFDDRHAFVTKGQIARDQARRALDGGLRPAWGTGDEVYGRSSELRVLFEQRGNGYVFAVGADLHITTSWHVKMRADRAIGLVEPRGRNRRSRGNGSKGRRLYDWAWIATASPRHHLLKSAGRSAIRASWPTTSPTSRTTTCAP